MVTALQPDVRRWLRLAGQLPEITRAVPLCLRSPPYLVDEIRVCNYGSAARFAAVAMPRRKLLLCLGYAPWFGLSPVDGRSFSYERSWQKPIPRA